MTEIPVLYSGWGFANRYRDGIFLHKDLAKPEFMELHNWIIQHELAHTSGLDLKHDFQDYMVKPLVVNRQYFKFFFTHPTTWIQTLPVLAHKNVNTGEWGLYWDIYRLIWLAGISLVSALFIWAGTW